MYMLNLLFEWAETNGRFRGDRPGGVLNRSMNWLQLDPLTPEPVGAALAAFDPETAGWNDLGQAQTLLIPSRGRPPSPENLCIRVRSDPNDAGFPIGAGGATLQLAVCFGRAVKARQAQASPLTDNNAAGGPVMTTFISGVGTTNTAVAWFFPLGQIMARPGNPNLTDRYEFSVGAIVTRGGVTHYYGEDPEVDIGL